MICQEPCDDTHHVVAASPIFFMKEANILMIFI